MNNQTGDNQPQQINAPPGAPQSAPPVAKEPTPLYSNVVIQDPVKPLPFWFYILFTVVTLIFFSMTFILFKTIIDRQSRQNSSLLKESSVTPVATKVVEPIISPTPVDDYLNEINNIGNSDDVATIESDLEKTDLTVLKDDFGQVEAEVNNTQ